MKHEAQRLVLAAVIPLFLLLVMFLMKFLEVEMDWDFKRLGVYPLARRGVFGIFAHPLVHSSFRHLLANALPFFFFAWCLYYFYREIASSILFFVWIGGGAITFLIAKPGWHMGASGLVYGLAFFLFFSGVLRKHVPLIAISLLIAFLYGGLVWNMFPFFAKATTSWEGHLSGAIAGTLCAFAFRSYGPQRPDPFADEDDGDNVADVQEEPTGDLPSLESLNQLRDVGHKEPHGDCQQNDAEELTDEVDAPLAQHTLHPAGEPQHNVDPNHVEQQGNEDVDAGILGSQGK